MDGYLLLADGTRFDGCLLGDKKMAAGWVIANTAVVGFQEMITDPVYKNTILAFTYPEIGNVGVAASFSESSKVRISGLVVKVMSEFRSHYLSEDSLENMLTEAGIPCLAGIDTRGLAVHLREKGEMFAAVAPAGIEPDEVLDRLAAMDRPDFQPSEKAMTPRKASGKKIAMIDLGVRKSFLEQAAESGNPVIFSFETDPETILAGKPDGVIISDGPGTCPPPVRAVKTIEALIGKAPILACGLGHVALGLALGCRPDYLKRGHHGANYPVRSLLDGKVEVTQQRHTVTLDRDSVVDNPKVELAWENINDKTVEGIRSADGSAVGFQSILAPPYGGLVNEHVKSFIEGL